MFQQIENHKIIWISPDGRSGNQITTSLNVEQLKKNKIKR
jgi:hypothetical protein